MPRCRVVITTQDGGSAVSAPVVVNDETEQQPQQQPPPQTNDENIKKPDEQKNEEADDDEEKEEHEDEATQHQQNYTLLRPYKKLDPVPIRSNVEILRSLHREIFNRGPDAFAISDQEKRQLDDAIDNLRYVAIAENHFPDRPSVLRDEGAIRVTLEMLTNYRFAVVFAGLDFLATATSHPLCAYEVAHVLEHSPLANNNHAPAKKEKEDGGDEEDDEEEEQATPGMRGLNILARVMTKFKNKTELQLSALTLLHHLAMARDCSKLNVAAAAAAPGQAPRAMKSLPFAFNTLDILRSEAISAALNTVAEIESNPHRSDPAVAEKVAQLLMLLVAHRPPLRSISTGAEGPSVADLFANVGAILPTLLRLGNKYTTRATVVGPVCRVLSDMCVNSSEALAVSTAPSLLSRVLRHFANGSVPAIVVDCVRALSQLAEHFLPLQIESLVMLLRVVMSSCGNPTVLTTCVVCNLHLLRLAETALETAMREQLMQRDESVDGPATAAAAAAASQHTQQHQHNQQHHKCLEASPEEEQIHHSKKHMRRLLELMQKETVPFVGAAYDHFADEHSELKNAADAYLKALGSRIRKQYYGTSCGEGEE